MLELGRSQPTIFLTRWLRDRDLQRENTAAQCSFCLLNCVVPHEIFYCAHAFTDSRDAGTSSLYRTLER
jgi:hypothetical protein